MAEWINVSDASNGNPIAVNLDQVADIVFGWQGTQPIATLHLSSYDLIRAATDVNTFTVTDQDQVRALREYVNKHILKDQQGNRTRHV